MPAPAWATLERRLLAENVPACREFYQKYYDERGYVQCVLRWGANDGPDDAFENFNRWPELHALGADDEILQRYLAGLRGHDPPVLRGEDDRRARRPRRHVRARSSRRSPTGCTTARGCSSSTAWRSRCRRCRRIASARAASPASTWARIRDAPNYDPEQEADPLDDQRQPRPDAAQGHGARLGRRSVRRDRLRRAARREHVSRSSSSTTGNTPTSSAITS